MAISLQRYIEITSGVGAGAGVPNRDLGGRFFTENILVPTNSIITFDNASDVGIYFGTTSEEYNRAVFYFGWVSKSITSPNQMSFARWANVAVASTISGKVGSYAVSQFTPVTTGDFTLTMGGFTSHLTAINLSAVGSLAAVATAIQTKIRAFSGGGAAWTSATVTYNATRQSFDLVSGLTGNDTISVLVGTTTDIASLLGWLTGAILSNGQAAQTITALLTANADASNDFGSFAFVPVLTIDLVTEAAVWNNTQDVDFIYSIPVSKSNSSAWSAVLTDIGGCTLTLAPLSTEYPEQVPMMILSATDYNRVNSVSNYMFTQFDLTPAVTSNADANTYDNLHINFYGVTQTAGTLRTFYQRGVMLGLPVNPLDQNTYANEIWLKDAMSANLMTLLLSLNQLPANAQGRAQVLSVLQGVINQALNNGTISVAKALSAVQKAYITTVTNDPNAWQQVFNQGYWVDVQVVAYVEDSTTKYKMVYTLIYSKDDVIRKIEGTDILI